MNTRPRGVRHLATAAAVCTVAASLLLEALLLTLALALLLAGAEPQAIEPPIVQALAPEPRPTAVAQPPLDHLPVVALSTLARQQLGASCLPTGQRIAQARRQALLEVLSLPTTRDSVLGLSHATGRDSPTHHP